MKKKIILDPDEMQLDIDAQTFEQEQAEKKHNENVTSILTTLEEKPLTPSNHTEKPSSISEQNPFSKSLSQQQQPNSNASEKEAAEVAVAADHDLRRPTTRFHWSLLERVLEEVGIFARPVIPHRGRVRVRIMRTSSQPPDAIEAQPGCKIKAKL